MRAREKIGRVRAARPGRRPRHRACLSAAFLLACSGGWAADAASAAPATDPPATAGLFGDLRWNLLNRSVYERRNYSHGDRSNGGRNAGLPRAQRSDHALEWGYGLMSSVESGFTPGVLGFGFDAHLYLARRLDGDDYTVGKIRMLPVDADGHAQDGLVRGGIALKARLGATVLHVGEQRMKSPVFSSSDTRLLPETMRGWQIRNRYIPGVTLHAGRFTGSTDRHARWTNNPLIVNYLDPRSPRGDAFELAGLSWQAMPELSLSVYLSRLKDTWNTGYLGAAWLRPLANQQAIGLDLHLYRSRDTGRALAGPVDATTTSLLGTWRTGPHKFGLGWQKVNGDTPFDYVSRGAIWLGNATQLSDFNGPNEQSWQLRYEIDASAWSTPGLSLGIAYIRGTGTDGRRVPANGGYAWLGYGHEGRHWERDLWLRYTVQGGGAKGLASLLRYGEHRANPAQAELNTRQIRLALEYPLGG